MDKEAQRLGRLGGLAKSESKREANRKNIKQFWKEVRAGRKPAPARKYETKTLAQRFWPKVKKGKQNECWNWTAGTNKAGYGKMGGELPDRKTILAPRASWMINRGEIPKGKLVCHKCDNRLCVNPRHLYIGTDRTNTDDKIKRNRLKKGSQLPQAKLTEYQVREIISTKGRVRHGASNSIVCMILKRQIWKHVKP